MGQLERGADRERSRPGQRGPADRCRSLRELAGSDRLLLGTDYPFPVVEQAPVQLLEKARLAVDDMAQISGDTTRRLFKLRARGQ